MKKSEDVAFNIIANAGEARSYAFEALSFAKNGQYEEAEELLKKAKQSMLTAHKIQTQMLFDEANNDKYEIDVLLIHSQDHFMTCQLAIELIEEMIELYKK